MSSILQAIAKDLGEIAAALEKVASGVLPVAISDALILQTAVKHVQSDYEAFVAAGTNLEQQEAIINKTIGDVATTLVELGLPEARVKSAQNALQALVTALYGVVLPNVAVLRGQPPAGSAAADAAASL